VTTLPTGWRRARVGDICEVVRGASPRPAGDPRYFDGDFLPWITVGEVTGTGGMYLHKTATFLTRTGARFTRTLPAGTLLLTNSGATLGVPKITTIEAGANDGIAALLNPKAATNEYLYFVLESRTDYFRDHLAPGNGQPNLNTDLIKEEQLHLPPIDEQRTLASLFKLWDIAVETTERLVAAKERACMALANTVLFGRTHRARWSVVDIGNIAQELSSTNAEAEADDLPVLSCTKHDGLVESLNYFGKQVFSQDTSKYKVVRRGQFAYATNHIEEGSIGLQDIVPAGVVSPMYTVFKVDEDRVNAGYLYKLLKTERLRQVFAAKTNASVDRRGSLRWSAFSRIQLPLPPIDEQRRICGVLDDAKRECTLLRATADALRLQKRGLMEKLLTGKWRVPIDEGVTA
jgi:type I restriction enzyme, S subunit